uniref:Uncharacterized protein n=1 Tax=Trichobilharzia regenti TaxID=157069 RepID=A0AA85K147_TRIRE|nr:unnamed protein product [Trichobilharzia regenti]
MFTVHQKQEKWRSQCNYHLYIQDLIGTASAFLLRHPFITLEALVSQCFLTSAALFSNVVLTSEANGKKLTLNFILQYHEVFPHITVWITLLYDIDVYMYKQHLNVHHPLGDIYRHYLVVQ